MSKVSLVTVLLVAALLATATYSVVKFSDWISVDSQTNNNVQGSYTYFAFEREWPGTVCKTQNCTAQYMGNFNSENFNLHGLWPSGLETNVCSYPQSCGSTHFNFTNIYNQDVVDYMEAYWVGLYSSQQVFLDHEWTKHGTCMTDSQNDYFTQAVELHQLYNPIAALALFGIVPDNNVAHNVTEIKDVLELNFVGPVYLQCQKVNGTQYLSAFDMYFDKDLINVIEQPCKKNSTCSNSLPVYIPTVPAY